MAATRAMQPDGTRARTDLVAWAVTGAATIGSLPEYRGADLLGARAMLRSLIEGDCGDGRLQVGDR